MGRIRLRPAPRRGCGRRVRPRRRLDQQRRCLALRAFEEAPPDVYRHVIETNVFGYIHGARAAIRRFREQGRGVLINNSSVFGKLGGTGRCRP
jgi:NAD(P)-dependent dehydrogenase (short-subunit alcohol dehydrogenase family)